MMDNAEEVMQMLEEFAKMKPQLIPQELDEYLGYVAKTGNPVFKWSLIKQLFREKMINVINEFYEDTLTSDLPPCPNVDVFNYERMKSGLLERLDAFHGAPFTVQRLCELLTNPRKEYNRADKFMRAIEKNILVVSTREPEPGRYSEVDCESTQECSVNGIQESTDALDATFTCNALGAVPVTSSHNLEIVDTLNVNTANETVPVPLDGENEVSSDTDDISNDQSLVNNKELEQLDKTDESTLNQVSAMDEEHDTSAVTSSNASTPIDSSMQEPNANELPPDLPDAAISTSQDFSESQVTESSEVHNDVEEQKETSESESIVQPTEAGPFSSVITNTVDTSEINEALPTLSNEPPSSAPECDQTDIKEDQFIMDESSEAKTESPQDPTPPQEEDSSSSTEVDSQIQTAECDTSEASVDSEKSLEIEGPNTEIDDTCDVPQSSDSDVINDINSGLESDMIEASGLTPSESNSEVLPTNSVPEEQPPQTDLPESATDPVVPVPDCQSSSEPMEVEEN